MASALYEDLVADQHSFIWDSSMSNEGKTMERINVAKRAGYSLRMIAVLTPMEIAICQAMHRASLSRRFPNPAFLPASHRGFREAFRRYVPYFDEVTVFASQVETSDGCYVVAEKLLGSKELAIHDDEHFNAALSASTNLQ